MIDGSGVSLTAPELPELRSAYLIQVTDTMVLLAAARETLNSLSGGGNELQKFCV
jgi:hypothetical protein